MDESIKATEFAVFCIENTAKRLNKNGADVFRELMRTGGVEHFIYPSFPALHTQSKEYIINEVMEYIRQHNPSFLSSNPQAA